MVVLFRWLMILVGSALALGCWLTSESRNVRASEGTSVPAILMSAIVAITIIAMLVYRRAKTSWRPIIAVLLLAHVTACLLGFMLLSFKLGALLPTFSTGLLVAFAGIVYRGPID